MNKINSDFNDLLLDNKYANCVKSVAKKYHRMAFKSGLKVNLDEFNQMALIAMWKALKKRDVAYGNSFLAFARRKMQWECADFLRALIKRSKNKTINLSLSLDKIVKIESEDTLDEYFDKNDGRKDLLEQYYIYRYSYDEIAKQNHISKNKVKKRIKSGVSKILGV